MTQGGNRTASRESSFDEDDKTGEEALQQHSIPS